MRLVFVAGNTMPTPKAHGVHVAKQCEAFAAVGAETELWYPAPTRTPRAREVFEYYDIPDGTFGIRPFRMPSVMRLERPLGAAFPYVFALYSQAVGLRVAPLARRVDADLYFTTDVDIAFWLTAAGAPTMWECHRVPRRVGRYELTRMFRSAALRAVVPLTTITRDELVMLGLRKERALVEGEGVDLRAYDALPASHECRAQLGLPLDRPIVAYVGRFRTYGEEKGIPELVRAMAHVPTIDDAAPLLVCVGGPMDAVPAYYREAAAAGTPAERLRFVDRVPSRDVPTWIRAADVAVMPFPATEHSARYMSPMKVFEYMAAGVPIVSTDLGAVRELLEHDANAWLVPPGDVAALARGIREILRNPDLGRRLAQQARHDVEPFDWTTRARRLLEFSGATGSDA
jgi:glycosyltransferase involved in cell wall biosynthesis